MAVCKCDSGIVNSGIPSCVSGFGRIAKLFFVYQIANDGTSNAIPCSQTVDEAFLTDKLNEADPSKRWYPTDKISNVTEVRNDPTTESIDNIDSIVEQGSRTFNGFFVGKAASTPTYLKFLKSVQCPSVMYFAVDVNGTLVGVETVENSEAALTGINIQPQSMFSRPVPATSTTIAKNELTFAVDSLVQDETIAYIGADEITADLLNANGLLDVTLVENSTPATLTEVVVDASLVYGSVCNKLAYQGAIVPADWDVNNITTPASITVTTVTENPNGTYTLEFAAQTASDQITVQVSKEGFSSNVLTIQLP
jgi:hypothetical protein